MEDCRRGLDPATKAEIRFKCFSDGTTGALPVAIRNVKATQDGQALGCEYLPSEARHHKLVADLIFANSAQWRDFQLARRGNPGLLKGTIWFLSLSVYQTYRGLVYLARGLRPARDTAGDQAVAEVRP